LADDKGLIFMLGILLGFFLLLGYLVLVRSLGAEEVSADMSTIAVSATVYDVQQSTD
jgi:hypothetical protein